MSDPVGTSKNGPFYSFAGSRLTVEERAARFWSRIRKGVPDDCWEWTAGKFSRGYGVAWNGKVATQASRIVWELTRGKIPSGMQVCHKCDNPGCCNPDHLFLGTMADNMQDKIRKNRQWRCPKERSWMHKALKKVQGENNPRAQLTERDVQEIRSCRGLIDNKDMADFFGVQPAAISKILVGRTWRSLPCPS